MNTTDQDELEVLIDILAQVINVVKVSSISNTLERERKIDAHNLANRFIQYAISILFLSNEKNTIALPSFAKIRVADPASIDVLVRAAMEAFLVFHYVYYSPSTDEESNFRYWTYRATGLAERQIIPFKVLAHKKQQVEEKNQIKRMISELKTNTIFQGLTEKQKAGMVTGHQPNLWRWDYNSKKILSWSEIAVKAQLGKMVAKSMYSNLSGHAHSGSLSVHQTQLAIIKKEVDKLMDASYGTIKILTANMIEEYSEFFEDAHSKLLKIGVVDFIKTWVSIGRRLE